MKSNTIKKDIFLLKFSVAFMFLFSITFLFMPFASDYFTNTGNRVFLIIVGLLFWITLFVAYFSFFILNTRRKKYVKKNKITEKKLPGICSFFSNKKAIIVDILMMICIVIFVILSNITTNFVIYIFLSMSVFTVQLHSIINGKNYLYIKSFKSEGKENEN